MATYIELTLIHTKANNINLEERGFDKQNSALRKKEKKMILYICSLIMLAQSTL